ncbi:MULTISPECIES: UvrD-helicase domain-containing protein [unclassified Streptomyces]|uniref:UvrD-helicase domain-containing protein n=1 Tax=unclassified Streptomyces TaxID=2593676 RepID=UPI0001C1C223|nr:MULTISPECIES: UvrD-helicase domain-containing protein [unclassified Streptomyces]AEN07983.1 UvrD/REP helicase [Streptomyces sp. SirexAA-E]MYR67652.1 UvrD-helicase domain-containing protein [Streptomyces sp. SID4939]MYR98926.1 UvrD-helicase domain-containing protein [Streptomyces sp. SID4940]MYT62121.1 UvrD-helicase domain-containing protein [Streptomyces sp. SID8357]MYT68018.1 UvrD-helicase domain-containing protein [Streptomyces sp. SID8357]
MNPTDEQTAAADAFHAGQHLALQAGAGTGKTTTLALLARTTTRRGRYLAYNRAIAQDACTRFPDTVQCKTAHALAYAAVGHRYTHRLNAPRRPAWQTGQMLGINKAVRIGDREVTQRALSNATLRTVARFCHTADEAITPHHVPRLRGLDDTDLHTQLAAHIVPFAHKAWADLQHPDDGAVRFDHDHYLKIWALTRPRIQADFLLLDEAQDTNPVVEQIFLAQRDHAQLVMVGDSAQAIYHWRGAKDIMTGFDGTQLALSQSFRFGPDLAAEANRWLHLADAPIRLTGTPAVPTELGLVTQPDAVLCRTNVGAMAQVMTHMAAGHRVALAGGGDSLHALALAARDLKEGRRTHHPELLLFPCWGDLQDYAAHDPAGRDLQPLVNLVDTHGADAILAALTHLAPEPHAHVTVSTAHKAKGREWPSVLIAEDFARSLDDTTGQTGNTPALVPAPVDDAEARLAYVAVTRTRRRLDLGGLSWIYDHPDGTPPSQAHPDDHRAGSR